MNVVIDGVIFQRGAAGIAEMWSALLTGLRRYPDLKIVLLDRGSAPSFDGIEMIAFPSYKWNTNTANDSLLLERICREAGADVFSSTLYTTPTTIPSVLVLGDVSPETRDVELSPRQQRERQIAINFASHYACVSDKARADLEREYPGTIGRSMLASSGVERADIWETMQDCLYRLFARAREEGGSAARREFVREWERLRSIQASVDPCRPSEL